MCTPSINPIFKSLSGGFLLPVELIELSWSTQSLLLYATISAPSVWLFSKVSPTASASVAILQALLFNWSIAWQYSFTLLHICTGPIFMAIVNIKVDIFCFYFAYSRGHEKGYVVFNQQDSSKMLFNCLTYEKSVNHCSTLGNFSVDW